jgi:hypothetical protein
MDPQAEKQPLVRLTFDHWQDTILIQLMRPYVQRGTQPDWSQIANQLNAATQINRKPRQCRERWTQYLSPTLRIDPLTPDEEDHLRRLVDLHGNKWKFIAAQYFPDISDQTLKNNWRRLQRAELRKARRIPVLPQTHPVPTAVTTVVHQQQADVPRTTTQENSDGELPIGDADRNDGDLLEFDDDPWALRFGDGLSQDRGQ